MQYEASKVALSDDELLMEPFNVSVRAVRLPVITIGVSPSMVRSSPSLPFSSVIWLTVVRATSPSDQGADPV